MNKKQLIALADMIRDTNRQTPGTFGPWAVSCLADFCADSNPAFKRDRWLGYIAGTCGPNGAEIKPK